MLLLSVDQVMLGPGWDAAVSSEQGGRAVHSVFTAFPLG